MKKQIPALILGIILATAAVCAAQEPEKPEATAATATTTAPAAPAATTAPTVSSDMQSEENVTIKKLEITGNLNVPDDKILAVIETKVGEPISTQKLEDDLQRIFDLGFFSEDIKVSLSEYEGGARVIFKVVEYPQINKITIAGNKAIPTTDILAVMETKEKTILNKNTLKKDVEKIQDLYKGKGYVVARVAGLDGPDKNDNLTITVAEGVIQSIEVVYLTRDPDNQEITNRNNTGKTKPRVIIREMKTKAGDTLNVDKIKKDLQRVFNLGLFNDVSWDIVTDPEKVKELGKLILVVQVEEAKTGQVGFGAGYSSSTGLTGFLSYSEQNLSGMGRRVTTHWEYGNKINDYSVGYSEPWIDKKNTSFEVNVYNTSQQDINYGLGTLAQLGTSSATSTYQEIHRGINFTVGRPISDYTRAYAGLKFENVKVTPDQFSYLNGAVRGATLSLRTDTRNNIFFPTTGRFDTASVELNGGLLGGNYNYQKLNFDIRRFRPFKKDQAKQTLAGHMYLGLGTSKTPLFDWYNVGGVNTVRGYDEYEFNGTKAAYFNAEYRRTLGGNLSGVLFADAGAVWNSFKQVSINPKDYVKSVGAGIRLSIPQFGGMGPIRLDYAYAISKQTSKIHFGFGHMF